MADHLHSQLHALSKKQLEQLAHDLIIHAHILQENMLNEGAPPDKAMHCFKFNVGLKDVYWMGEPTLELDPERHKPEVVESAVRYYPKRRP